MATNIKDIEARLERIEKEVAALQEILRKAEAQPVDPDALSASITSHAVTDEDTTDILAKLRRPEKDWWKMW